jgi:hypothetical protein
MSHAGSLSASPLAIHDLTRPGPESTCPMTIDEGVRLQICTDAGPGGSSWWPRSLNLTAELPALLRALWSSGRDTCAVVYNPAGWNRAPRAIAVSRRYVRLEASQNQDPHTVCLIDSSGSNRTVLQVVPPRSDRQIADAALRRTACTDPLAWLT